MAARWARARRTARGTRAKRSEDQDSTNTATRRAATPAGTGRPAPGGPAVGNENRGSAAAGPSPRSPACMMHDCMNNEHEEAEKDQWHQLIDQSLTVIGADPGSRLPFRGV